MHPSSTENHSRPVLALRVDTFLTWSPVKLPLVCTWPQGLTSALESHRPRGSFPSSVTHSDLSFLLDSHIKFHLYPAAVQNHHLRTGSSQIIEYSACSQQMAHAGPLVLESIDECTLGPMVFHSYPSQPCYQGGFICDFQTTLEGSVLPLPFLDGGLQSQLLPISQSLAHSAEYVPGSFPCLISPLDKTLAPLSA